MSAPTTIRQSALALVRRDLHVFKLQFRKKEPLKGTNGFKDATNSEQKARAWFCTGKLFNVGVRTGTPLHGLTLGVLDLDGPGAMALLDALERERGRLPETFTVHTGNGQHRYFLTPARPCRIGLLPGVDFRGVGGYIVGPCSFHPSGKTYECVDWSAPIVVAPEWLIDLVTAPEAPTVPISYETPQPVTTDAYAQAALSAEKQRVRDAAPGTQDPTIFSAAWRLARFVQAGTLTEGEISRELASAASGWMTSNFDPRRGPWTRSQIERRIERGLSYGLTSNRWEAPHAA